jgi:3-oxoacyl-[acyl-carrier protein] reductase
LAPARRVLIAGGSGGIGGAVARACARRGAWPLVGFCGNEQGARQTVADCGRGETFSLDLRLDDFGRGGDLPQVDAVVHAAGAISERRTLLGSGDAEMLQLLAINAIGPLRLTRALLAAGSPLTQILFVLSTAVACRGSGPYAVSKVAALAIAKLLAGELERSGARVHAVVPGWTETAMAGSAAEASGRDLDAIRALHPQGRILHPDEIGLLCARLLFEPPLCDASQVALWDRRIAPDPIWRGMDEVLAFDRVDPG